MPSEHKILKKVLFRLVKSHIAGSTLSAALDNARENNAVGVHTTITFLNNGVDEPTKARYNANSYMQLARQASRLHLNADLSVRPTQLGYALNEGLMDKCLSDILGVAQENGTMVWLEAEKGIKMEQLFDLYRDYRKTYKNMGVEIPIWYPLEVSTIKRFLKPNDNVKLSAYSYTDPNIKEEQVEAKGGKAEKKSSGKKQGGKDVLNATPEKRTMENYISTISRLLQAEASVVVLESDEKLVARLAGFSKEYKKNLIFELPLGYSQRWLKKLSKMKTNLSVYTPYGKDWAPYVVNKLTIKHGHIRELATKVLSVKDGEGEVDLDEEE